MNSVLGRARKIPFRSVNRRGRPGHDPAMQRHHLLPRQLLSRRCFGRMFDHIDRKRLAFDDFRSNGLLLPAREEAALRVGLPMHRGPHRTYNEMVIERVGQIEQSWSEREREDPVDALEEALMRMRLLQAALRRRLLQDQKRIQLNSKDPLGNGFDFSELDAMAESLYRST